jgi:hypothetical protein
MSGSISLFDDTVEYYRQSGLSKDGRWVMPEGNPRYVARQAAIDIYRKQWSHECQFQSDICGEAGDQDPEGLRHSSDALDADHFNSASAEPNQEEKFLFNEAVEKILSLVEENEQMVKLLFVKIRRLDLEHYLKPSLLNKSLQLCGEHTPQTDFEEAVAVGFSDVNRGKAHSNQRSRTLWKMQDILRNSGLAA